MDAALLVSLAVAAVASWIARWRAGRGAWLLVLVPAGLCAYVAGLAPAVARGDVPVVARQWVPALGAELALRMDGLSLLFALLITGMGALVVIYAQRYLDVTAQRGRFFSFLLLFMSAMLGVVLADDLFLLFVFWELTSISSFLLIGFESERDRARSAALQSLLVTASGGLAMLAGFVLLALAAGGTSRISEIVARADVVRGHALHAPALVLIALGAFTKSAQFPFHFWLPGAMAAPTPVSAYLHSATMVKAGVYLLARLAPALGDTILWSALLIPVGVATMVLGALLAVRNTDLKRVLAYTTIAALGMLVFLLGAGSERAIEAVMVLLVAHALYKGALFLVAGAIEHEAGSRDVTELGGLGRAMPVTAAVAALAAASMAGLPPLLGFAFKELTYAATLGLEFWPALLTASAVLTNALGVVAAGVVAARPFWTGRARPGVHEAPPAMWLPPLLLAGAGLAVGVVPGPVTRLVLDPAIAAILGRPAAAHVTAVPHWSPELVLSVVTVAAGVIGYLGWDWLRVGLARADRAALVGPERGYGVAVQALLRLAVGQTRVLQHGYLRYYLFTVFATYLVLASCAMLIGRVPAWLPSALPAAPVHEWLLMGLSVSAALAAILTSSRLTAVTALAVLGFTIALLFLTFGAIDLAMTQFLVEMLIILILLLVMRRLPALEPLERPGPRAQVANVALAAGVGLLFTLLLLGVVQQPFDASVSDYYSRASVPQAHGRNIVNVILVDFRALDTLGEIAVIATAALGVWALLKARDAAGGGSP